LLLSLISFKYVITSLFYYGYYTEVSKVRAFFIFIIVSFIQYIPLRVVEYSLPVVASPANKIPNLLYTSAVVLASSVYIYPVNQSHALSPTDVITSTPISFPNKAINYVNYAYLI
jgi:hypothetical protein